MKNKMELLRDALVDIYVSYYSEYLKGEFDNKYITNFMPKYNNIDKYEPIIEVENSIGSLSYIKKNGKDYMVYNEIYNSVVTSKWKQKFNFNEVLEWYENKIKKGYKL